MKRAALGASAHLGWAATAIVAVERGALRVLRTDRIETSPAGDREALEPFHVAGGFHGLSRVPRPDDPAAVVRRGLRKQRRHTARAIGALAKAIAESGHELARGGVLASRGRAAPDLEKSIGSHTQIHVEEGIAVRAALSAALEALGARVFDIDQKGLAAIAADTLGDPAARLDAALRALAPENGGPWRKEERQAALAAWVALRKRG